ncbi:MAG: RNA polymerase sigma factor [Acidimicrobiales bacterium]
MSIDDEIVTSMRRDLDAGFVQMVESYAPIVTTLAGRVSGRAEDAEDLAAETFFRAYRALRNYNERRLRELQVRPWLVTIALNLARNSTRDAQRRPKQTAITETTEPPAPARETSEIALGSVERDDLARRLSSLSEPERVAVVLRHVVELPVAEIAEVLGCKEATARSHIARGLAHLRSSYDKSPISSYSRDEKRSRRGGQR